MTNHISVLIKPASSLCNLRCKYCFYHSIAEIRELKSTGIMTKETATSLIKKAFKEARYSINFAFQGGEPTLAGLDFFKMFVDIVDENNKDFVQVNYSLQTNGTTMTDEWAEFFTKHNFLIGLSLDGDRDINDHLRIDTKNKGTYDNIIKASKIMDKYNTQYNILIVLNGYNAKKITAVYNHFKKRNFKYLQFIPCLDPLGEKPFSNKHSLTPEIYEEALKKLFILYRDDFKSGNYVSIRFFDNLISILQGKPAEQCGMNGSCACQYVIEGDGTVYPCDFYCLDQYKIGNINENTFEEMYYSKTAQDFLTKSQKINDECKQCKFFKLCVGGCRRNKDYMLDDSIGKNFYCDALKGFYTFLSENL